MIRKPAIVVSPIPSRGIYSSAIFGLRIIAHLALYIQLLFHPPRTQLLIPFLFKGISNMSINFQKTCLRPTKWGWTSDPSFLIKHSKLHFGYPLTSLLRRFYFWQAIRESGLEDTHFWSQMKTILLENQISFNRRQTHDLNQLSTELHTNILDAHF